VSKDVLTATSPRERPCSASILEVFSVLRPVDPLPIPRAGLAGWSLTASVMGDRVRKAIPVPDSLPFCAVYRVRIP